MIQLLASYWVAVPTAVAGMFLLGILKKRRDGAAKTKVVPSIAKRSYK